MVPLLTRAQIARLKHEGFLLLPNALEPASCARVCDAMWRELTAAVPRIDRADPSSWTHFTDEETPSERRSNLDYNNSYDGGDPRLNLGKGRFYLHNGCDPLQIETFVHPLKDIVEQLLGKGEVVWPRGLDEQGMATGPVFADGLSEATRAIHTANEPRWPPPDRTEEMSFSPSAGCVSTLSGQGTRGLYCTLPEHPRPPSGSSPRPESTRGASTLEHHGAQTKEAIGLHSDVGLGFPGRVVLRAVAFVDDCPPGSGGFTLWPHTHIPVWEQLWGHVHAANRRSVAEREREWDEGVREGAAYRQRAERWVGIGNTLVKDTLVKDREDREDRLDYWWGGAEGEGGRIRDSDAVELHGPAGTVLLIHAGISHSTTENMVSDVVRTMTVIDFHKTEAALPDEVLRARFASDGGPVPGVWEDWADCVRNEGAAKL